MTRILSLAIVVGLSGQAWAQSDTEKERTRAEVRKTMSEFNALPAGFSPPQPIKVFARRLTNLDPAKGKRYYKVAMLKMNPVFIERKSKYIGDILRRIVRQSDLTPVQKRRVERDITLIQRRVIQFNQPGGTQPEPQPIS